MARRMCCFYSVLERVQIVHRVLPLILESYADSNFGWFLLVFVCSFLHLMNSAVTLVELFERIGRLSCSIFSTVQ